MRNGRKRLTYFPFSSLVSEAVARCLHSFVLRGCSSYFVDQYRSLPSKFRTTPWRNLSVRRNHSPKLFILLIYIFGCRILTEAVHNCVPFVFLLIQGWEWGWSSVRGSHLSSSTAARYTGFDALIATATAASARRPALVSLKICKDMNGGCVLR